MSSHTFLTIAGSAFLLAFIREGISVYRKWKARRPSRATDKRLRAMEIFVISAVAVNVAFVISFAVWFVAASN